VKTEQGYNRRLISAVNLLSFYSKKFLSFSGINFDKTMRICQYYQLLQKIRQTYEQTAELSVFVKI